MSLDAPLPDPYGTLHPHWFRRCGDSGLQLPALSLGCWHNFGTRQAASGGFSNEEDHHRNCRAILREAYSVGITHFDLANNYGPAPGMAEERVGRILREDFSKHRDELVISSKAGYRMWPGPYGNGGSRKYLISSCDQSLQRLGVSYLDVFYHHCPDTETPLAETLCALNDLVRTGKTLYIGLSNYSPSRTETAIKICRENHWALPILHQPKYSLLDRRVQDAGLFQTLERLGMGSICFSPLQGGLLTGKYLKEIPEDSRLHVQDRENDPWCHGDNRRKLLELQNLADNAGIPLVHLALLWTLRKGACTSALMGASRPAQVREAADLLKNEPHAAALLQQAETILLPNVTT